MSVANPALTVVVLSLNEAERIARCVKSLASLPRGTRLVLVDSFSSDATVQVLRDSWREIGGLEKDLCVIQEKWPGFTKARNRSLDYVTTPWVLWLDADEWLSPELAHELGEVERLPSEVSIGRLPRLNSFLGREIRHGGWFPDIKSRLGRAGLVEWRGGPRGADVHEDLVAESGRTHVFRSVLRHEPFRSEAEQRATNERYSGLLAEGLASKWRERGWGKPPSVFVWGRVVWKFFENYLWKRGFLDGAPGWKLAMGSAWSLKERYRKARELV